MLALLLVVAWHQAAAACPPNAAPFTRPEGISENEQVQYAGPLAPVVSASYSCQGLFTVSYYSTYKVIKYNPTQSILKSGWPDPSMRGLPPKDLVLYECGTSQPTTSFNDVSADAQFFSVPLEKTSLPWTGVLHFFELLGVSQTIQSIDMSYHSSPCTQLLETCTPGIHASGAAWVPLAMGAEAVFTDSWGTGATNTTRDVVFDVSVDRGILPRAEWIRFAALFFNQEVLAGQIFEKIEGDYKAMQAEATRLRAASNSRVPSVAWATWQGCVDVVCDAVAPGSWAQKADGNWCRCGSFYRLLNSHFRRDITADAGAQLLPLPGTAGPNCTVLTNSDGTPTYECIGTSAGLQHYLEHLALADVIIDETFVSNHGAYTLDDFVRNFGLDANAPSLKAREGQAIYRIDGSTSDPRDDTGTVGSSWFEQMPTQPQVLLSDMMHAIWGNSFKGTCTSTYLRHLYTSGERDPLEHSDCPLYDAGGNHDCAGIHAYEHQVHQCASPQASTDTADDSLALALGLGLGIPLGLILIIVITVLIYRCNSPKKSAASPISGGGAVVGVPVMNHKAEP